MEPVLRAIHITKYFLKPTKFKALDDISFEVPHGEFLTLVGRSGSGKSTLLYVLSTMDTDYEGRMEINNETVTGKSVAELSAIRNSEIGFVFQFHYLLAEFTSLRNVMLPALRLGKYSAAEIEHRAMEKLELLGVADQALKPTSQLSGGQQQRISIARALINDPRLIMCDEPTGNLDSKNANIVLETFQRLAHEKGQTLIVVTHDNGIAEASDRTLELMDGRFIDEIKRRPQSGLKEK